jgi:2-polyprenyl-3-methyl-5-hydroxy-6-metoxy-1,4-benzoquinol methylase
MPSDSERARSYFDQLAPEYDRAFRQEGTNPFNAVVNRFFRGPTFATRMRRLESIFEELHLEGQTLLDLGCGSGQVSLLAASMGARVIGIDIAPRMLEIARTAAKGAGLGERIQYMEGDVDTAPLPPSDVVLLIGVIEYYEDFAGLIHRAAGATRRNLIVAHTNRVPYRMLLRRLLFSVRGAPLHFHSMDAVVASCEREELRLMRRVEEHAFTVLVLERTP